MNIFFARILLLVLLPVILVATMPTSLFSSDPIFTPVPTGITGRVWIDINGSGNREAQEIPLTNLAVYIQRIDQSDFAMTLVVYTDAVGGYAAEGLPAGTYQIWTENDRDGVYLVVVTIDDNTPTVTANLPIAGYQVFMPTIVR
jgi:hypothetical protein